MEYFSLNNISGRLFHRGIIHMEKLFLMKALFARQPQLNAFVRDCVFIRAVVILLELLKAGSKLF